MNGYEILATIIAAFAVLSLVVYLPALIVGARSEAKAEAFKDHADVVLATHHADVRNRNLEANKAARWQG